jgi:hypothetical protein
MYDAYRADLQTQEVGGNPGRVDSLSKKKWKPKWELHQTM